MTVRTSTQAGNLSSSSTWGGSSVASGDQIVCNHAVTVDTAATLGYAGPVAPVTVPTLSSVAGGGALATATYRALYSNIDAAGNESARSPESATLALTNGNTLRVTLPALPTGVSSRRVYLTTGATLTEKLYATGNTTTTKDCTSASWTDGTTTEAAAVAFPNGYAITIGTAGSLTINTGVTSTVRGDGSMSGNITLNGTAIWEWDASTAQSPANTPYACFQGTSNSGQTGIKIQTAGTSAGNHATIRSNAGGANGYFRAGIGAGAVGNFIDTTNWNVSYLDFVRVGDVTRDAVTIQPTSASNIQTFSFVTWDASSGSLTWAASPPAGAGWSITDCVFNQTACRAQSGTGNPNPLFPRAAASAPTGTRLVQRCVFVKQPYKRGNGSTWLNNYYDAGWDHPADVNLWTQADGEFVRLIVASGQSTNGGQTGSYVLYDPAHSLADSGTATAGGGTATTGTLTDSGKAWTVNQFQASPNLWFLKITGGTGSGQIRRIKSNTATVLTVDPPWSTTPDSTSTYQIWTDAYNPHYLNVSGGTSATVHYDDNVFEANSADHDGDCVKSFTGTTVSYTAQRNIVTPNLTGKDCSGTLITMFNNTSATITLAADHNTVCCGSQSGIQVTEGGTNQPAGTLLSAKSNIFWSPLTAASYTGGLQSFKICDTNNAANPAGDTLDIVSPANADFNNGFNTQTGGFAGNGYNLNESSQPGAHDFTVDPQFVDSTRNLAAWDASLGGAGTVAAALARLKADTTQIAVLLTWVKGGFAPRNATLKNAGHDGVTIGAVEGVWTVTQSLSGTLTQSGGLAKGITRPLTGALTLSTSLARSVGKALAGALTAAGSLLKLIGKGLAGALGLSGSDVHPAPAVAPPVINDAVDFVFTQADAIDFVYTQDDAVDFPS